MGRETHQDAPERVERITIKGKEWTLRTTPLQVWVRSPGDYAAGENSGLVVDYRERDILVTSAEGPDALALYTGRGILAAVKGWRQRKGAK